MGITHFSQTNLKATGFQGGNPGDHTVTGIAADDALQAVVNFSFSTTDDAMSIKDYTSEFSVSAANTINNDGGTTVTAKTVNLVLWSDKDAS